MLTDRPNATHRKLRTHTYTYIHTLRTQPKRSADLLYALPTAEPATEVKDTRRLEQAPARCERARIKHDLLVVMPDV